MSKKDQCMQIAISHPNATRQELVELFMSKVGLSNAHAGSYASTIRKELELTADVRARQVERENARANETDAQIAERLKERFAVIDTLARASTQGKIRSLIVSGPAGLGKSFTIEQAIKNYDPQGKKTVIARGYARTTGLYMLLHEYRNKGNVIILDDIDSIFNDMDALNLLKAALDTTEERIISWRSETKMTDADGNPIDREFEFEGTIIFITNIDFDEQIAKDTKMAEHYEALLSRSHYVNTDMNTVREYVVRIKQVVGEGMLQKQKNLNPHEQRVVMSFLETNAGKFRELTLRAALKLADVYKINPANFESLAKVSMFKTGFQN